ncbi:MAG: UDP-N-acetylmuramoyl-L-alanyl-D-glutamate--2,6-diaminopimelate ligase [Vallitaleaceae bacterium]|nr:UDP-N-acetylmuramoyl-L-alanyl-D-glutamate--2,6-diaminopimelate ligase [Vallitaleaceae bacterium]
MKLSGLLDDQAYEILQGTIETNVKGIANDSRKVVEEGLFIAIKGYESDGHLYIGQSLEMGASAIILEDESIYKGLIPANITVIKVENARKITAYVAAQFYNTPTQSFKLIGVTGTNGKTTTTYLINNVLEANGKKTGLIGTIANKIGERFIEAERTTPDSIELNQLFREMADENVNKVVMEVSSHALDLHRVDFVKFDVGVFTNLSHDHLDYHKTLENYMQAKAKLFNMCKIGILNKDDPTSAFMKENGNCEKYLYYSTKDSRADFYAHQIRSGIFGVDFELVYEKNTYSVHLQTPCLFSVYNGLAAIAACVALGLSIDRVIEILAENSKVKGRFEPLPSPKGFTSIIDYAHTPDGLENVLSSMKEFAPKNIITVFGCGGDRDKTKRPIMGEIAGRYSNYVWITSDNPRTEDPFTILDEIEEGIKKSNCPYEKIEDRKTAIYKALDQAQEGDLVLIAGKGHEDYQIIGKTKHHFDDAQIVMTYYEEQRYD